MLKPWNEGKSMREREREPAKPAGWFSTARASLSSQQQLLGQLRTVLTDLGLSPQNPWAGGQDHFLFMGPAAGPWQGHTARDAGLDAEVSGCRCLIWC